MYFKKLELVGFKSFCEKTSLSFEPGITAIVGPNGCGKSNIFDSIRWVLGEQSAKSLRGSEMLDVIFNGTDKKEPVGMAEVTLTFDNQAKFFNVENDEVAISRRIFRSGESEYLLNKAPVRLKDILDLLLGTGIGAESYSIVAQGKIDLVLSSRPEDRRLVFDEASGITKYKSQKREALRKMEETEQNLLRVNDIVTEVKRQIGSLERQANKARRYKEAYEELKSKEINLSILEKEGFLSQKDAVIKELAELERLEAELFNQISEQESRIHNRQAELKTLEDNIMSIRNETLNLENLIIRNKERIDFNNEKFKELAAEKMRLEEQKKQVEARMSFDQQKLNNVKEEYSKLQKNIDSKSQDLNQRESEISAVASSIKGSLDAIGEAKRSILEIVTKIAAAKNDIVEFNSQQQVFLSRKKRLEIEKSKAYEEKAVTQINLDALTQEAQELKRKADNINLKLSALRSDSEKEVSALCDINCRIEDLEKQRLGLASHKEFLEKLKSEYEDIGETMNAVIYLDKLPTEKVGGLVIKIKDYFNLSGEDKAHLNPLNFKLSGEAKPIELDTRKIDLKLAELGERIEALRKDKASKEAHIEEINKSSLDLAQQLRQEEIALANKQAQLVGVLEQFNRIKEEEDIIVIELQDVNRELSVLEQNLSLVQSALNELNNQHRLKEDLISRQEENIAQDNKLREETLVAITQLKTELNSLKNRLVSDSVTLKILQDAFDRDRVNFADVERQIGDTETKKQTLTAENSESEIKIKEFQEAVFAKNSLLKEAEVNYQAVSAGASDVIRKIESDRKALDQLKNKLHGLAMQSKDIDYKFAAMKERMLAAYKVDLEGLNDSVQEQDPSLLGQQIAQLRQRLDSYGTVNLVAIEEYDELKKRYDFLTQQQNDLLAAKESLHQAVLKINRTTKQMFMETFEKVRVEFRNYFRLLFNGGDAQVFLIDEQDPLESGIEIICRPPGKKLQNVLLLSGGEKSMSAIALIFAIFKVKPSPFCILDEIDAALDEANVDRFSNILQEFSSTSQFIVITHNKRTIVNANVMYGITMEESGVSRIVSVKFAKDKDKNKEPEPVAA